MGSAAVAEGITGDARTRRLDLLAYLVGLAFGLGVLVASGYADWSPGAIARSDFAKFWVGPRAVLLGLDPFDALTWRETATQLGASAVNWPDYGYFGWTIVLMLPFAIIPLARAFRRAADHDTGQRPLRDRRTVGHVARGRDHHRLRCHCAQVRSARGRLGGELAAALVDRGTVRVVV